MRREGELYTRLQGEGKRSMEDAQDGHKLGDNSCLSSFLHCGRAPADSRGPTGKFPLHAKTRTSHVAHVAGFGSPAYTGASPYFPEKQATRQTELSYA